uniref:Olfactory receptor family 11 subfamily M member 3 n=1 Tax=Nannospalax galili TaxID=1026970 RepID=A0A8C6RLK3_NANGA
MKKQSSSDGENRTTWLILLGFGDLKHLGFLPFTLFLAIYLVTVGGNIIVMAVASSQTLHTPMCFFLCHFSLLETGYSSNIISLVSCLVQFYVFASLAVAECLLLSAMSYDHYLAICHPLHYPVLMSAWFCGCLAIGAWLSGFFFSAFALALAAPLSLCPGSRVIDHYFCDFAPVVGLFCGNVWVMLPYTYPLLANCDILCLHPEDCAENTFRPWEKEGLSTCSTHLSVVGVFYGTLIVVYVAATDHMPVLLGKTLSVLYTVVTPMVNPIIYSLKNQEIKGALHRLWRQLL